MLCEPVLPSFVVQIVHASSRGDLVQQENEC